MQRLGDAVLAQGPAVADLAFLVRLGLRYRAQVDGCPPAAHHRALLAVLSAAADATNAAVSPVGHADVREAPDLATSGSGIGSEVAARLLGVTSRTVRRQAVELGGRRVGPVWTFDRAAVLAAAARRRQESTE